MSITRYKGQPLPIIVSFDSNPLTIYGKAYSDVTEVSMNLKEDLDTDLDDAFLEKKLTLGDVTIDETNHKFIMDIDTTDYGNLVAGSNYLLTLSVLVNGYTDMLEMSISDEGRKISIVADTNRA